MVVGVEVDVPDTLLVVVGVALIDLVFDGVLEFDTDAVLLDVGVPLSDMVGVAVNVRLVVRLGV